METEAVIFDLDGTLTNTLEDIGEAMNTALRGFGLPEFPLDDYRYLVGNGAKILAERAVRDRQELAEAVHQAYQHQYETHSEVHTRPYEGIPELLRELTARCVPVCVFSNKPHADTVRVVQYYFPDIPFAVVHGQTDDVPIKPDPTGALRIAAQLGAEPARCLYLGDTSVDMQCAVNAGMEPVGVLWGFRGRDELLASGAKHLLHQPLELLALL